MGGRSSGAESDDALIRDYECVSALGVKRTSEFSLQETQHGRAAFERLVAHDLAIEQHGAIVLRRPEDYPFPLSESVHARLLAGYLHWLRADPGMWHTRLPEEGGLHSDDVARTDELLYGELGFWQHWWNQVRERDYDADGPLPMDIVVPDDGTFEARSWLSEFDPDIRSYVLGGGLLRGRAIVPARALKSVVEPMLDLSTESGFEVRVLSTEARFVLYGGCVAVLNEPRGGHTARANDQPEPYWAVRNPAIVEPLRYFFAQLWRSAIPFRTYRGEHDAMLELLARGHTDAGIAQALNLSGRTVSRRVSEIMAEHGAGSRFELGMMYGRSRQGV